MKESEQQSILEFLRSSEQLKDTLRNSYTVEGRQESTAEHTWRLCLMVLLFEEEYPDLDILRLMKICLVHDLGEAINGDIAATDQVAGINKDIEERRDLKTLCAPLPEHLRVKILGLWDEYTNASSKEGKLAKAFDKLETILQHTQGVNAPDFDYFFNLSYGVNYTSFDPLTSSLREIIDVDTKKLAGKSKHRKKKVLRPIRGF